MPDLDWTVFRVHVADGKCTAVIGPGLIEPLIGTTQRRLAQDWAEKYGYPMAEHLRRDLPRVAQYVLSRAGAAVFRNETRKCLNSLQCCEPDKCHRVLAGSPIPVYITTNPDYLLEEALLAKGKEPRTSFCLWKEGNVTGEPGYYASGFLLYRHGKFVEDADGYRPDEKRPLVYHLFGGIDDPESMVMTEDDHFQYLISITRDKLFPAVVRRRMSDSSLLFLGFRTEDWNFRVAFNGLLAQEGGLLLERYNHVAVQVDPEGEDVHDLEGAKKYLESYFRTGRSYFQNISVYWGSPEDFIDDYSNHVL